MGQRPAPPCITKVCSNREADLNSSEPAQTLWKQLCPFRRSATFGGRHHDRRIYLRVIDFVHIGFVHIGVCLQSFISITQIHTGSDQRIDVLLEWLEVLANVVPVGWAHQAFCEQDREHEPWAIPAGVDI